MPEYKSYEKLFLFRQDQYDYKFHLNSNHNQLHIVFNEQDRDFLRVAYANNQFVEIFGLLWVHTCSRLVQQEKIGLLHKQSG